MNTHGSMTLQQQFQTDGVVCLRRLLDAATLAEVERLFQWSLDHPTPSGCRFYEDDTGVFYQDLCNPAAAQAYRTLLVESCLADRVAELWGERDVWFLYEQVFLKQGGDTRRTPWHQDAPYLAVDGEHLAVAWINLDPVPREDSLEFVRGSQHGTLYDGSAFDDGDDTKPIYGCELPRLPDIEADRARWDIVSFDVTPGDVVFFHPRVLHGGAPTHADRRRRTLSLRFFGPDAVYVRRPAEAPAPLVQGLHETLTPGMSFRHPAFPRLRPAPQGFESVPQAGGHARSVRARMQSA